MRSLCLERSLSTRNGPKATTSICPADDIHPQPSYIFVGLSLCRSKVQFALRGGRSASVFMAVSSHVAATSALFIVLHLSLDALDW